MTTEADPIVDEWYHYPEKAQKFKVTGLDEHSATVEIQFFDGTVDEFDIDTWRQLDVERIETPEDWTGPLDNIDKAELNKEGAEMQREDWEAPYMEVDEKKRAGPRTPDGLPGEAEEDDWGEGRPQEESWPGQE